MDHRRVPLDDAAKCIRVTAGDARHQRGIVRAGDSGRTACIWLDSTFQHI
jgi:hypothetical protein